MAGNSLRATKQSKDVKKLPKGAKVVSRETTYTVKEIENGYITCRRTEYRYTTGKDNEKYPDYMTIEKEVYTKDDPLEIKIADDASLADAFEDDED